MTDVVTPDVRSRMMSAIRGKNTRPEMAVRRFLHARGLRYRLHDRKLPGAPDLVFPKHRVVVFIHGCYWHRHADCRLATTPSSNVDFWLKKFSDNVRRDVRTTAALIEEGWRVIVLWECGLRGRSITEGIEWLIEEIKYGQSTHLNWPQTTRTPEAPESVAAPQASLHSRPKPSPVR